MNTIEGKKFDIPKGNWKHIKKSSEWEQYNENPAKNKVGDFSPCGAYLKWETMDGKVSLFMEVKTIFKKNQVLFIRHRSGLCYWFVSAE